MTAVQQIDARVLRTTIEQALDGGERFAAGWATTRDGLPSWRVLLARDSAARILATTPPAGEIDSIIELAEAADWDEREAHDLYGLGFDGHEPMRALVNHTDDLSQWTTPAHGPNVHDIAVGPIHAGIIESGHFRFHAVGERILMVDLRLFYKHRGLEHAAEGLPPEQALAYVHRACAACSVTNTVAFAQAVEDASGLLPDRDLRVNRTVLLELERVYNHLNDISAVCAGVGFAPGTEEFAALKDRTQNAIAAAAGHRFLFGTVAVAGGGTELDAAAADKLRMTLRELHADFAAAWRELKFTVSLQARLGGIGIVGPEDAVRLGTVGPAARAAGLREDLRSHSPLLAYSGFEPAELAERTELPGDVDKRFRIRAVELEASFAMLDELLLGPLARGVAKREDTAAIGTADGAHFGLGRVESPRGATSCVVELASGVVERVHLRTGAYANWPSVGHAVAEAVLSDFPLINKSFELCYACVDR